MLPRYTVALLQEADALASSRPLNEVYRVLRKLPLADFCTLHLHTPPTYRNLAAVLPVMPPDDVQKKWTGDSGLKLMARTCNVMRLFEIMSFRATANGPRDRNILDYGCGWGRLLRIANYFSDLDNVYGLDVMQSSLDECAKSRIPNQTALVPRRPEQLPFGKVAFDVIFSFSVFTHIPDSVARAVLQAARRRIADNGVFIITIRSYEFWSLRDAVWPEEMVKNLQREHDANGYAFQTFNTNEINADYGDTTMSFGFLEKMSAECGWRVSDIDRDLSEPYQIAVALRPA